MRKIYLIILIAIIFIAAEENNKNNFYNLKAKTINGKDFDFNSLRGKKVLIVNVASNCGYTNQYKGLEELYQTYKDSNFVIIGFPSNDFSNQEPGTNKEIAKFCEKNYGVSFLMMEKIVVKGEEMHPVYKWLTKKSENGILDSEVKWNFQKYMINADGILFGFALTQELPNSTKIVSWIGGK